MTRTQRYQVVNWYLYNASVFRRHPVIAGTPKMYADELNIFEIVHPEFFEDALTEESERRRYLILQEWRAKHAEQSR